MKIMKKISAIVLAVLMVVSVMPISAIATELPEANVTEISVDGLDVAYTFTAVDDENTIEASPYKDYKADFVVSFDKDIEAGEVTLAGSYDAYENGEWVDYPLDAMDANEEIRLLESAGFDAVTYSDVCTFVKEFNCGAKGTAVGTTMTVALNIYDAEGNASTICSYNYTFVPAVKVEKIDVDGLDVAYKFTAPEEAGEAYAGYIADYTVSFDKDIPAETVTLAGSYDAYENGEWVDYPLDAMEANEELRLLETAGFDAVTFGDLCDLVKVFSCGVKGVPTGTTMTVTLNLYDENGTAIKVCETAYTAAVDEMSITVADKIDLNIYPAVSDTDAKVVVDGVEKDASKVKVENGQYVLEVVKAPAEMMEAVKVEIKNADGDVTKEINTSIADYCKEIIENSTDAGVVELAKKTLDYGKAASAYFDYDTESFADYTVSKKTANFSGYDLEANASGITITGVSYRAVSVPELRFDVDMTEEEAAGLDVTCVEGYYASFAKVENSERIVIQVTGIPAAELGETIHLNVSNGATINYTPIAYAKAAYASSNAKLKALGAAIANYSQAADAYFA